MYQRRFAAVIKTLYLYPVIISGNNEREGGRESQNGLATINKSMLVFHDHKMKL